MAWHRTVAFASLAEGRPHQATAGDDLVLLVRRGATVHAVAALCPHKATSLGEAVLMAAPATVGHEDMPAEDGSVECPLHHALFSLATGAPAPGNEWAGRLQVYPVRIEDGVVLVEAP